jgi:tyrosyl-tRNA synthetase
MTNYKHISLLTVFSNAFEKAMHTILSQHLHTDNILATEEYGFKKGRSIENAAFRLTESVFKSINQKCMLEEFSVILQRLSIA